MAEITVNADNNNLSDVLNFIDVQLEKINCIPSIQMQIDIAVEEIFTNISNYAYNPDIGEATICCEVYDNPCKVIITFLDKGKPYNPLNKEEPDIFLNAEERQIGGLGVFMVKKIMDSVEYKFEDGKNILTVIKKTEGECQNIID